MEVPEVQGWRRGEEGRKDGEGRRPGREEVVNALLDPVKPGEGKWRDPFLVGGVERSLLACTVLGAGVGGSGAPPNPAVHMFYYAWYGNLQTDGRWWHWDHRYFLYFVLCTLYFVLSTLYFVLCSLYLCASPIPCTLYSVPGPAYRVSIVPLLL